MSGLLIELSGDARSRSGLGAGGFWSARALLLHLRANDVGEAKRARAGGVAVGEDEIEAALALGALAQGNREEGAALQLALDRVLREPRVAVAQKHGVERGRLVRHGPALLVEKARRALALDSRVADHDVT